jgi:hypothetical protein
LKLSLVALSADRKRPLEARSSLLTSKFQRKSLAYSVKATVDGHVIFAPAATAKDAFATAIDWHVVKQLADVSICDASQDFSIGGFSEMLAGSVAHSG